VFAILMPPTNLLSMSTRGSFSGPGTLNGWGVTLTKLLYLLPRLREWYKTMYLLTFSSILACVCVSINLCTRTVGLITATTWRIKAPLAILYQVSTSLISATRTGNRLMQTKICNGIILSVVHSKITAWLRSAFNF